MLHSFHELPQHVPVWEPANAHGAALRAKQKLAMLLVAAKSAIAGVNMSAYVTRVGA